ncbi:uncharacterized protein LY89DRAFT_667746 [Mollisia scopiformis]|uniref:Uncharacterized protein n=1 Tax=Mollisia scopiformis TaxID=149040 RepID=A0A194XFX2_MOLSC|nr:uncharacterized protein LY89DRAFT_667746 [Mollisia scopiformis]KUJ18672.1 hypothetical protein LY89DRAFT_667746 [Mollisia scopiformis]
MSKLPTHLKMLRRPRSPREAYEMWRKEGGGYQIGVRLNDASSKIITEFRLGISKAAGCPPVKVAQQNVVFLFAEVPASGLEFYEDTLATVAKHRSPFRVIFEDPFVSGQDKESPSVLALEIVGLEIHSVYDELWEHLGAVPRMRAQKSGKRRLKMNILSSAPSEKVKSGLLLAGAELRKANLSATAIGLCLRFVPVYAPRERFYRANTVLPDWQVIPFQGSKRISALEDGDQPDSSS